MAIGASMLEWIDDAAPNVKTELSNRFEELTKLEENQVQAGTAVPQLYGSLSRFIANPSTVSVETFKRMLDTDETQNSCVNFLNLAMIARFGDYTHKNKKIQALVRRVLDNMEGSWHGNLDEMFSAEWAGFSTTEKVWKFDPDFDGFPAYVIKKLCTYAPLTMVFAVDRNGVVLPDGIFQYQRYHQTAMTSLTYGLRQGEVDGFRPDLYASVGDYPYPIRIASDLTYLTVKIPKDKIIHLRGSGTGKFDNPYGRSVFRSIYKNWVIKDAALKMWVIAADRKGTPLLVGWARPNDTVLEQNQKGKNDRNPETAIMRADLAMSKAFKTLHNSSFIVLPGKKDEDYSLEAVQTQGDMNVFKDLVEYCNKAIMRGMLIPPLVMSGGDGGGAYSLGQEHHKIFRQSVDGKLKPYKQAILEQLIRPLISYNFPEAEWKKDGLGSFEVEEFDPEVMEKLSNIFASLTTSGYMSPTDQEDMDEVRQKMNLKPKKAAEVMDFGMPGDDGADGEDQETADNTTDEKAPVKKPEKKEKKDSKDPEGLNDKPVPKE